MEVVLLKDIKNLGTRGEVRSVGDGYALNFLIPRRDAVSAVDAQAQNIVRSRAEKESRRADKVKESGEVINALPSSITLKVPANESGTLFRSVSATTLEDHFKGEGVFVSAQWFSFSPIKDIGTHRILIKSDSGEREMEVVVARK